MKVLFAVLLFVAVAACSRRVDVGTGTPAPAQLALHVTNNASQPVNVYVTYNGSDTFAGQVAANSTQQLALSGLPGGSTVTLKARTADGTRTYLKENVTLQGTYEWTVP